MEGIRVKLGSNGRVVIPAELRRALGVKEGDELLLRCSGGELRITTPRAAIRRAQELVRRYLPADVSLVDELIDERREAAEQEV